jgi:hypothetical protein
MPQRNHLRRVGERPHVAHEKKRPPRPPPCSDLLAEIGALEEGKSAARRTIPRRPGHGSVTGKLAARRRPVSGGTHRQ